MMNDFFVILSEGIQSVGEWMAEIGNHTIGISLITLCLTVATIVLVLKYLVLPAGFGSGSDVTQRRRKR